MLSSKSFFYEESDNSKRCINLEISGEWYGQELRAKLQCGVGGKKRRFDNRHISKITFNDTKIYGNAEGLFKWMTRLNIVDGTLDVSCVSNMSEMFADCRAINSIDLKDWNVSNLCLANEMFKNCYNLRRLPIGRWNTSSLIEANEMFKNCEHLENLEIDNWNTDNLKEYNGIFSGCPNSKYFQVPEKMKWYTQIYASKGDKPEQTAAFHKDWRTAFIEWDNIKKEELSL